MKGLIRPTTPPRTCITIHYSEKDAIKYCYTVMIFDQSIFTTFTSNYNVVEHWIGDTDRNGPRNFGFEIVYDFNSNRIGTLQLCDGNRCLVIQLDPTLPFPLFLDLFLADENSRFMGIDITSKVNTLRTQFPFKAKVMAADMCKHYPFLGDKKQTVLNSMPLGKVEGDWDRMPCRLTVNQVHYACLDAFLNIYICKTVRLNRDHLATVETIIIPHADEVVGAIKDCYDVFICGETVPTTVTKHPDAVREWIDAVRTFNIGFEIEYTKWSLRIGAVQLYDGVRCLVLQVFKGTPLPPSLVQFLVDNKYSFLGDNKINLNIFLLKAQFPFTGGVKLVVGGNSEESIAYKYNTLNSVGLEEEDWSRAYELSHKQVHYACVDAFLNHHIARKEGRIRHAREELIHLNDWLH